MKYAHYRDETGELLGWYSEEIHGDEIPTPSILISEGDWEEALEAGANFVNTSTNRLSVKDLRTPEKELADTKAISLIAVKEQADSDLASTYISGYTLGSTLADIQHLKTALDISVMLGNNTAELLDYYDVIQVVEVSTLTEIIKDLYTMFIEKRAGHQSAKNKITLSRTPTAAREVSYKSR